MLIPIRKNSVCFPAGANGAHKAPHPVSPVSHASRYNTLHFASKVVCQRGHPFGNPGQQNRRYAALSGSIPPFVVSSPFHGLFSPFVKFGVPIYVCINLFSSFLRNDSDPGLATKSVIAGGVFNIFGDYFCVFTLDMGIRGAGIATAMGAGISTLVMLTHFFKKSNTLRLQFSKEIFRLFGRITVNGFSSFIIDVAMGVLTMLFNRQIMKYLGTDALAVYGVIVSVSTLVQCCSYGIGQASQPIISQNYGAGNVGRIKKMLRYNIITAAIFGAVWAAITFAVPNGLIRLFMTPTASVLAIAPAIIRIYGSSFLLLSFNVYSTYYFQATMRAKTSMFVSVARGILISGALILIIPVTLGADMIWWAMPVTELVVAVFAGAMMAKKIQL